MTQQKRKPWLTAAALVVAGLLIAGLSVWTSDPVQKAMAPAELAQESTAEASGAEFAVEAADEDKAAAAAEKKAAAEDEAAAAEEEENCRRRRSGRRQGGRPS
jgi:hypothetical protein